MIAASTSERSSTGISFLSSSRREFNRPGRGPLERKGWTTVFCLLTVLLVVENDDPVAASKKNAMHRNSRVEGIVLVA